MILQAIFFYLFAGVCIASAVMVIASRNPVHSVLFLILAFVNAAGLFVLMGAEFLAMILIVVYVGAVAVLFLFVVMMLDVDFAELREGFLNYLPVAAVGHVLYTRYVYYFQIAGLVLLVAMIGAIVLTLRHKPNVKRQNVADQVARTKATAIEIRQVRPGQGMRPGQGI